MCWIASRIHECFWWTQRPHNNVCACVCRALLFGGKTCAQEAHTHTHTRAGARAFSRLAQRSTIWERWYVVRTLFNAPRRWRWRCSQCSNWRCDRFSFGLHNYGHMQYTFEWYKYSACKRCWTVEIGRVLGRLSLPVHRASSDWWTWPIVLTVFLLLLLLFRCSYGWPLVRLSTSISSVLHWANEWMHVCDKMERFGEKSIHLEATIPHTVCCYCRCCCYSHRHALRHAQPASLLLHSINSNRKQKKKWKKKKELGLGCSQLGSIQLLRHTHTHTPHTRHTHVPKREREWKSILIWPRRDSLFRFCNTNFYTYSNVWK